MEKVVVNKDLCIGCGMCIGSDPEHFAFNDEGLSSVIKPEVNDEEKSNVLECVEMCPTDAILVENEKTA